MAHNDIGKPQSFSGKTVLHKCGSFDKGVVLCTHDRELSAGQSPYIMNMIYEKNMLRMRPGQVRVDTLANSGVLHSYSGDIFFGRYIFHVGTRICGFDGENASVLYDDAPDCDSFMFEMNSMLYIFCRDIRIFTVNENFEVSEHIIRDTKLMKDAKYNLSEYTALEVEDNMIMYRVCVDYLMKDAGTDYYILPTECDTEFPLIFTQISTGKVLDVSYTVNGTRVDLKNELSAAVNISYIPAKETEYRNFEKIFGCKRTCTYGGRSSGGTRVFFTGNDDYPGHYFYSELLSPLHVKRLSYDILGNGREKVTDLAKQKGDLIAFCENSVYRMVYTFSEAEGADFLVNEISTGVGCDVPGSVQLIDNRLVFANSDTGIYIIVSSEYTDELSIRRISANINGNGTDGFLYENRLCDGCVSSDYSGKYMLVCPSGNAYIWDYGNSPYVAYDDPLGAEKRLSWYIYDSLYENSLFAIDGVLYGTVNDSGKLIAARFDDSVSDDFGSDIVCIYRSCGFDAGDEFAKKTATELLLNAEGVRGTKLMIYVFVDDVPVMLEIYDFDEREEEGEKLRRLVYSVPGFSGYRVTLMLMCSSGKVGLYDAAIRFNCKKAY